MTNNQQEAANSSYISQSVYDLDFVSVGDLPAVKVHLPFSKRLFSAIFSPTRAFFLTTIKLSWEMVVFNTTLAYFFQRKLVAFVYFLEGFKDLIVSILMWRRGFLFRPTIHGGLLVIGSLALLIGGLFQSQVSPKDFTRDNVLAAANTPETIVPEGRPRAEIVQTQVKEGQTLAAIASAYSVSVDSIKWANGMEKDDIKPGDNLAIPPVTGMIHKVKGGDSVQAIAEAYKANAQALVDYPFNYIDDSLSLKEGQTLFVPDGVKPEPPKPAARTAPARSAPAFAAAGSGFFTWPVPAGHLSQSVSWYHPAVDIGAPYGSGVYAAAAGKVIVATYQGGGFGTYVTIDHGGYTAAYAHMSGISVGVGQEVSKGQLVGYVGCSGRCTGPHLHFEVRRGGAPVNPYSLF